MLKFSVITPVHLWSPERAEQFARCIDSLAKQTYKSFEWIVIDDGSTEKDFFWDRTKLTGVKVKIRHTEHEERVIAYNKAFEIAEGEWFCLLDSDDEFKPNTLEKLAKLIERYPQEKMFNFGAIYQHKDGSVSFRDPFYIERKKVGHKKFGGGNIVNGTFMWHRSVYDDLGAYPKAHLEDVDTTEINYGGKRSLYMGSPYDFSAAAQLEFPEIREYFLVNHEGEPHKIIKELGNPWGQDYYLFYKYTRKYHSRIFKEYLYLVNPR